MLYFLSILSYPGLKGKTFNWFKMSETRMVKWFQLLNWSVSCLGQLGLGFEDLENFALSLI